MTAARWTSARTATSASSAGTSRGWLAEEHPEVLDWEDLNEFASDFATSESGGAGQFLGSDPSYVQFDEAIISNLGLDFKVVFSGGEAATISAFEKAQENKEFLIGYFWEPQYIHAEVPMEKVALPPYEDGCQDDPAKVDCDYPETPLKKIASTSWVDEGGPGVDLVAELHLDQRRPEPGRDVHHRRQDVAGGRRRQVDRGEPGQGRRLARLSLSREPAPSSAAAPARRSQERGARHDRSSRT